ncbi:hypothetical protein Tco_0894336 [Tanacetum coccineum]|uniref:CCHC-type domain-containing protein n=1 Tax=Tanacetum coccineum TaxID=301880 RepID=A0ABQ5CHS2_9ASTR
MSSYNQPQYETYSCEFCGNDAHYGYDCPPQVPFVYNQDPCFNQSFDNFLQTSPSLPQYLCCTHCGGPHETFQSRSRNDNYGAIRCENSRYHNIQAVSEKVGGAAALTQYWKFPIFDDDDDEYTIQYKEYLENSSNAITPDLSTEEPDNSLSMGDEHLDTIPETESDEVIKSSVEDLVPIPSESEADFDPEGDIRLIEQLLYDDYASSDDDPLYSEDIDYVEASPPDSELVSLEENAILNDNPTPDCVLKSPIPVEDNDSFFKKSDTSLSYSDNSLPEFETFSDHTEETSSGSTTTHADNSLPEYDSFLFETEPDQGELTSVVMEDILGEPRFQLPSGLETKIFEDPGIFIEVQSKRFLSPNEFSISFIRDPLSLVFDTLLPFSSKNEEKVFNPGSLSSNEEKSPHLLSHRGFNPSKIISDFSESPMMISGGDIPILDVLIAPDYEAFRAHGFVLRSLELQSLA